MSWMRAHLARAAGAWLALQLCLAAATPAALCSPASSAAAALECTCDHGNGEFCPMHHPAKPGSRQCSCRGSFDPSAAIIASLLGPSAVLTPEASTATLRNPAGVLPDLGLNPINLSSPPVSPPPRA